MATWLLTIAFAGFTPAPAATTEDRPDAVVADFEGEDYAGWTATGSAFGTAPARGTFPGQMTVEGFVGRGLVNSYLGGDASTGTLTSPPFTIERPFLNFLIGGGKAPGELCLDLLVGGAVVRTETGPNGVPGGSERLDWAGWDVREWLGKPAVLRVVDRKTGGWGHVNVDQIVQSDRPRGLAPTKRELAIDARYLHLPVRNQAPLRRVRLSVDGRTTHEFETKLADGTPDFWVFTDLSGFRGKTLSVESTLPIGSESLGRLRLADRVPDAAGFYKEAGRPAFHFTSRRGWLNDPNGLVWHDGEYHLYYQHNPYGWDWGNMHWGHAVSPDLVHWTELPIALYPKAFGDWAFSGSAVVDHENTSGFGKAGAPAMVAAFTSTGRGECIVYSNDRGRTWTEFAGNPVVKHTGRDPRLLWHGPSKRWVMAVYDETGGTRSIQFFSAPDLKSWTYESRVDDFFECPELFELPVDGSPGRSRWVLYGADGKYLLGAFDGHRFKAEPGRHQVWHGNFYASQTFTDAPGGRRVQVGWATGIAFSGMPFNQQMNVPCVLTLRPTADGVRMFAEPVRELDGLHGAGREIRGGETTAGGDLLPDDTGGAFDVRLDAAVAVSTKFTLRVRGTSIVYDAASATLSVDDVNAPLAAESGAVMLRVLVDRASVEVFGNGGRVAVSKAVRPGKTTLTLTATGGPPGGVVRSLRVDAMKSTWK